MREEEEGARRKCSAPCRAQYVLNKPLLVSLLILVLKNTRLSRDLLCAGQGPTEFTSQPARLLHIFLWEVASQFVASCSVLHNTLFKARDRIPHVFHFHAKLFRKAKYVFFNVSSQIRTPDSVGLETQLYRIPLLALGSKGRLDLRHLITCV